MDPRTGLRRSPRLADSRPQYPRQAQQSPEVGSAFHSSSSLSSISSINTNVSQYSMHEQLSPSFASGPTFASAPLPSPSQTSQGHYFEALSNPMAMSQEAQNRMYQFQQQQLAQQNPHQPSQQQQSQQQSNGWQGTRGGAHGGMPETVPYLKDLSLVAEAAKRAQMACLMRDLGECEL